MGAVNEPGRKGFGVAAVHVFVLLSSGDGTYVCPSYMLMCAILFFRDD